jgi:hypothetical protein
MAKNPNKFTVKAYYDRSVDGGAQDALITLADNFVIPDNAIPTNIIISVDEIIWSLASNTITFRLGEVGNTTYDIDISGALGENLFTAGAVINKTMNSANYGPHKTKGPNGNVLKLISENGSISGGKATIYVEYYLGYAE